MQRRAFVKSALACAAAASGLPSTFAAAAAGPGLKDVFGASGKRVGFWLSDWMLQMPAITPLLVNNFNHAMIGNLKWEFIHKSPTAYDFSGPDRLVAFCRQHRMTMHGHNLCWNASYPNWLPAALTPGRAEDMLREHITTVMTRYKGAISSYDVVNEPVATWKGRSDGLYTGPWLDALGPEYIDIAFHAAAEADPSALRVLNTTHVEQLSDRKGRAANLQVIEGLLKRGVPVQAIGMESHLFAAISAGNDLDRAAFISALRGMGLKILITELDVNDTRLEGSTGERDAAVAACYRDYLTTIIPSAKPEWISFFCYSDARNWYDAITGPDYTRTDGVAHRPGLVDVNFAPKPAYSAALSALRETNMLA